MTRAQQIISLRPAQAALQVCCNRCNSNSTYQVLVHLTWKSHKGCSETVHQQLLGAKVPIALLASDVLRFA
jgi:hypothetical protein